ncbi:hypothetical protein [Flagellimonas pacifica]|uniref:HTTM-like domain-containing protein n=1 Tax=Flagellimonas pacifica TaxID=1247520 RepID=A0A285MUW5_9FLAO|nr:hypothetical protein [Allomuricauda parva]SNZ00974.1 hypothetical protein SAMN06265377_2804 [Allomuricauda parva]
MDYNFIFRITVLLVSISCLVSFSEWYVLLNNIKVKNAFAWEVYSTQNKYYQKRFFLKFITPFLSNKVNYLLYGGMISSILLIIGTFITSYSYFLLPLLFVLLLLKQIQTPFGLEGSDQMQLIVVGSLSLVLLDIEKGAFLAFVFISIQLIFSYFFAGLSKIKSQVWRNGDAITLTLKTNSYGNKAIFEFLKNKTKLSKIICWFIISWEILFILSPFLPTNLFYLMVFLAFLFHLSNALIMRLNGFFLTWISTFPSIVFFHLCLVGEVETFANIVYK